MACDSCWTNGQDLIDTLSIKIRRLSSGALLGGSGGNDGRAIEKLLDKVKSPAQLPTFDELQAVRQDFLGLLVLPKGQMFKIATTMVSPENWNGEFDDDLGVWQIQGPCGAAGSGTELAMGAMAAGRSAKEAVIIACRYDINSRPPVHVMRLAAERAKGRKACRKKSK
jgi:hypothetical protein